MWKLQPGLFQTFYSSRLASKWVVNDPIDPKYDKALKQTFGVQENKSITKQLIQDVTKLEIEDLTLVSTNVPIDHFAQSQGLVDILCETSKGKVLVEIQTYYQRAYLKRLLYYWSKFYEGQMLTIEKEGKRLNYYETYLRNFTIISILSKPIIFKNTAYCSTHKILDCNTYACEFEGLEFHLIDLTKFNLNVSDLTTNVDVWAYFFKNIHVVDEATVKTLRNNHKFINKVINQWEKLKLTKEEYEEYLLHCMSRTDNFRGGDAALRDDIEAHVRIVKIAKKLLARGRPIEEICADTGLNKEDFAE